MKANKIILHISDRDKWHLTIGLATELIKSKDEASTEIVILADVFAGAVCIACDRDLKQKMIDFIEGGQRIVVCEASLRGLNMPSKSLPDFFQTVPLGLNQIVRLQKEGFHYIKI